MVNQPLVILTTLAFLSISFAPVTTADGTGDAGSSGDASDDRAFPTRLARFGSFSGSLGAVDTDWYAVDASITDGSPACVEASTAGDATDLSLEASDGAAYRGFRVGSGGASSRLAIASPGLDEALVSLRGDQGVYDFDVRAVTAADFDLGDARSGQDAGTSASTALRVAPGCVPGTLASNDAMDVFALRGTKGAHLALSYSQGAGPATDLYLVSPNGRVHAQLVSGAYESVTLSMTGPWYLVVVRHDDGGEAQATRVVANAFAPFPAFHVTNNQGPVQYSIGIGGGGEPDPEPCRPNC